MYYNLGLNIRSKSIIAFIWNLCISYMHFKSALLLELKLPHICNDIMTYHDYNCYSFVLFQLHVFIILAF